MTTTRDKSGKKEVTIEKAEDKREFQKEFKINLEKAEENNLNSQPSNWKESISWGQKKDLSGLNEGIMKITSVFRANEATKILQMTSQCGPIACATVATGQLRKMNIIHSVESVGPKIAALYGMGNTKG